MSCNAWAGQERGHISKLDRERDGGNHGASGRQLIWNKVELKIASKGIQPVHPKGDQSWVFIGRTDAEAETPILWPPHVKS